MNVYLIDDEPLTLVDAGPNSATSFDELTKGLDGLGHSLEDIELVVLTHQHIDHLGLVSLVAQRSGADVAAIDVACRSAGAVGKIAVTQAYLTLSEVLGHIDLLTSAGRVREVDRAGTSVFEAA